MENEEIPAALQPSYRSGAANEPIELLSGELELVNDSAAWKGRGRLLLDWLPAPGVRFYMAADGVPPSNWMTNEVRLQGEGLDGPVAAYVESAHTTASGKDVAGLITEAIDIGSRSQLAALQFHLLNLPAFLGVIVRDPDGTLRSGRIRVNADGFCVTIDQVPPVVDELQKFFPYVTTPQVNDGYVITHFGEVRRIDGRLFSFGEVKTLVRDLELFLSFARGAAAPLILITGLDARVSAR